MKRLFGWVSPVLAVALIVVLVSGIRAAPGQQISGSYYADEVLLDSPSGYWRLAETSGTVANGEVFGFNGTYTGVYTQNAPGAITDAVADKSVTFTGAGSVGHVTIPNQAEFNPTTALTLEGFGKIDTAPSSTFRVVTKTGAYRLQISNALKPTLVITIGGVQRSLASPDAVSTGAFHHFAGTYDGTTMTLYVDGVSVASTTAYTGAIATNANAVFIGDETTASSTIGSIDEVAIYPHALSLARIQAHVATISTLATATPTATGTPANTSTPTATPTNTSGPTPTLTATPTNTSTATPTATATFTPTPAATATPNPSCYTSWSTLDGNVLTVTYVKATDCEWPLAMPPYYFPTPTPTP